MLVLARFSSAGKLGDDGRQQFMLCDLDPRLQGFCRVIRPDLDLSLREDFPGVHAFIHVVHGTTGDLIAGGESLSGGLGSAMFRQEGRMHVDDASRIGSEKGGAHDTHETGQDDQLHFLLAQDGDDFFLGGGIKASACANRDKARGARTPGEAEFKDPCVRLIGEHGGNLRRQGARVDGAADGGEVRAVPRTENAQAEQVWSAHLNRRGQRVKECITPHFPVKRGSLSIYVLGCSGMA